MFLRSGTSQLQAPARVWYLLSAIVAGLGLLGKLSLVAVFTHAPSRLVLPFVLLFPCLPLLLPLAFRLRRAIAPVVLLGLFGFYLVAYPHIEALHKLGRGSDQAECVVLGAHRMAHHLWPYVAQAMSSRNAMSCGPGWIALQTPVTATLGYRWNLALCSLISLVLLTWRLGWDRTSAIVALLGLSGGTWLSAANGCDFLTFGIALAAIYTVLAISPLNTSSPTAQRDSTPARIAAVLLLALFVQFRAVTITLPALFRRQIGRTAAVISWLLATAVQIAFLLWNAPAFIDEGPLHIAQKLLRTTVLSPRPGTATLEFVLLSAAGFAALTLLDRFLPTLQSLLVYLLLVFGLPAFQNLLLRYNQQHGSLLRAFEFWEGGVWVEAMVPLAALAVTLSLLPVPAAATEPESRHSTKLSSELAPEAA